MNAELLHRFLSICAAVLVAASFSFGWRAVQAAPAFASPAAAEDRLVRATLSRGEKPGARFVRLPAARPAIRTGERPPIHGGYVVARAEPAS